MSNSIKIVRINDLPDSYERDLELVEGNYFEVNFRRFIDNSNIFGSHLYPWPEINQNARTVWNIAEKTLGKRSFFPVYMSLWDQKFKEELFSILEQSFNKKLFRHDIRRHDNGLFIHFKPIPAFFLKTFGRGGASTNKKQPTIKIANILNQE